MPSPTRHSAAPALVSTLCLLLLVAGAGALEMKGQWLFDSQANPGKATVGSDLTFVGSAPTWAAKSRYGALELNGTITTKAGIGNHLLVIHDIGANGGNPNRAAEYTLAFDLRRPSGSQMRSIFQADLANANDAEYHLATGTALPGSSSIGYAGNLGVTADTWVRLVIAVKLGSGISSHLIKADGSVSSFSHAPLTASDADYSLDPAQAILFGDDNGENAPLTIGQVAIFDQAMSPLQVAALGKPGGLMMAPPLVIEEASPLTVQVLKDGDGDIVFNGTAASGSIAWSVSTPPTSGSAVISSASATQGTVRYTPAAGYSGPDLFILTAASGGAAITRTVNIYVRDPSAQAYPEPAGWWEFSDLDDHDLATLGLPLVPLGAGFQTVPGISEGDGAVEVKHGSSYRINHGIPGGTGGGIKVNTYTLLLDLSFPDPGWKSLYQTDLTNTEDASAFIDSYNRVFSRIAGLSTATLTANTWYRLVITVDSGTARQTYVNGQPFSRGMAGRMDDEGALAEALLLFADNDFEDGPMRVSNAAIWGSALDAAQVAALGGPGFFLSDAILNHPPAIAEGPAISECVATAVATSLSLHASDPDGDELAWSVSVPPGHGSVQITASSATECTLAYTSAAGYNGPDTFSVSAGDGHLSATTSFHLLVRNDAPVIAGGDSYLLAASRDGGPFTASFSATDANGDVLAWSLATAPAHGSTELIPGAAGICAVAYTPVAGHSGGDTFVLRVSDGLATAETRVTAITSATSGDPVLTVISAHGTTDPPAGNLSLPSGTHLSLSATDETGTDVRHICTGWTLQGTTQASGSSPSCELTLNQYSVVTWHWRTDYRIVTAVTGGGSIGGASDWHEAGRPLLLTATPASGYHFTGWTGDTAGCTRGGRNLLLAMDRPYGTISANFAEDEDFTIVALPDPQKYTLETASPDTSSVQTQWVLDNLVSHNIKYLTHEGDLVESPHSAAQWEIATAAINLLNGRLPYGVVMGNHDFHYTQTPYLDRFGPNPTEPSSIDRWTDAETGERYHWIGGYSPRGYSVFHLLEINGRDFLFLHLDLDCPDSDLAWAEGVLATHPRHLTLITTHNYLAGTGGFGGSGTGERGLTSAPGVLFPPDRNKPETIFKTLIEPFNQVFMVICGHNYAAYSLPTTNLAGRTVHQVLCNYQSIKNGGNGFLRLMEFQPSRRRIHNTTYSPTLGRFYSASEPDDHAGMDNLHDPNSGEFTLDFEFEDRFNTTLEVLYGSGPGSTASAMLIVAETAPLVTSVQPYIEGLTRYRPTGWSLSGGQQAAGLGDTASVVLEANARLFWSWAQDYWLDTATVGNGVLNIGDGWQSAGSVIAIVAQAAPGSLFVEWSGDLEGCMIDGAVLSVPMDRPRGPLTASFSVIHTLTIVSPEDSVQPPPGMLPLPHGSLSYFSAVPKVCGRTRMVPTGWTISGAEPASGSGSSGSHILSADATLTWQWAPEVYLEIASGVEGLVLPMDAAGWKPLDATVNLEAAAASQFDFACWRGDVPANSCLPQLALVMDEPRLIIADFTPRLTAAGTPLWWLDCHALVTAGDYQSAEAGDADGDGQSARGEFLAGTSDLDPKQKFEVSRLLRSDSGEVQLTWTSAAGRDYSVSRSHDLVQPFAPLGSPLAGVSPTMSASFAAAESRNFYRVEASLSAGGALDPDSPGLSPQSLAGQIGRAMRPVPAGWFTRGDDAGDAAARPAHTVWVAGFAMDRFEVTRADWEAVAAWGAAHGYDLPLSPGFDTPQDHPATGITWYQAVKWCNARSEMDGLVPAYHTDVNGLSVYRSGEPDLSAAHVNWAGNGYRLPTEAEWERASRGGLEGFAYPWGNASAETRAGHWDYALLSGRAPTGSPPYTLPVGFFDGSQQPDAANGYDLHDMVGNVREWTWDRITSYGAEPLLAPCGPDAGSQRVLRGGSWQDSMTLTTNANRSAAAASDIDVDGTNGFRCVRGLHPNEN